MTRTVVVIMALPGSNHTLKYSALLQTKTLYAFPSLPNRMSSPPAIVIVHVNGYTDVSKMTQVRACGARAAGRGLRDNTFGYTPDLGPGKSQGHIHEKCHADHHLL